MSDEVPPAFICPISFEIMQNPVLSEDGFTYEATAISAWFDKLSSEGKPTRSPLTGEDVGSSLFFNKLLLVQIAAYRAKMNMGAPLQQVKKQQQELKEEVPSPPDDEWTVCAKAQRSSKGKAEAGAGTTPSSTVRSTVDKTRPVGKMLYCFYCKCFGHEGWLGDQQGEFVLDENGMRRIVCERLAKKQEADRSMGRAGDWTCQTCSMLNFVGKTICFVCSAPSPRKPSVVTATKSHSQAAKPAKESASVSEGATRWACSACTFEQPWVSACSVCETPNENHWKPVHGLPQKCYVCSVDLTSGDVVHIHGRKHATNVALRGLKDSMSLGDPSMKPLSDNTVLHTPKPAKPTGTSVHVPRFHCDICALDMAMNQEEPHVSGKKHKERLFQMVSQTSSR